MCFVFVVMAEIPIDKRAFASDVFELVRIVIPRIAKHLPDDASWGAVGEDVVNLSAFHDEVIQGALDVLFGDVFLRPPG